MILSLNNSCFWRYYYLLTCYRTIVKIYHRVFQCGLVILHPTKQGRLLLRALKSQSSWNVKLAWNLVFQCMGKIFLAATKQLYKWYFPSVRLSVCLSVRHTFLTMFPSSYHHEIFWSYYQWQKWRPCKSSRSEVKGQGHRGHNPTLPFPDCNSSLNSRMMMKWCI